MVAIEASIVPYAAYGTVTIDALLKLVETSAFRSKRLKMSLSTPARRQIKKVIMKIIKGEHKWKMEPDGGGMLKYVWVVAEWKQNVEWYGDSWWLVRG